MPTPKAHRHRQLVRNDDDGDDWNGDVQDLECLGNGISGIVFAIDSSRVVKIHLGTPRSVEDFKTERAVYRRFNEKLSKVNSRYVLRCLDTENPRGLVFQRCRETVRTRIRAGAVDEGQVMRWAKQAAKGMAWVHDCKVIQGDVGCHNMLLDFKDNVKLADFAGSSIDDSEVSVGYEVRSQLPDVQQPTKRSDIFALGSAMYEMATGHPPYAGLSYKDIQNKYRRGIFPADVENVPELGNIIRRCWEQRFANAWDVVRAFNDIESELEKQSKLRNRTDDFIDSAISIADALVPEPEIGIETLSLHTSRRQREHSETYVHQSLPYRKPRHEKDGDRQRRKRRSHVGFISWINRSIHPRTHYDKSVYYI